MANTTLSCKYFRNNLSWIVPLAGILILSLFLFGGSDNNTAEIAKKIPGGGFGTFLASSAMFFLAWKFQVEKNISKWLVIAGLVLFTVWAWPRILPVVNSFGISPNIILALTIFVGVWVWRKGAGAFWWRRLLFLFLLASMTGSSGGIIKTGWKDFQESTGISLPKISIPPSVAKYTGAIAEYLGHRGNHQVSKMREAYIESGTSIYKLGSDDFVVINFDYSEFDSEQIKIFLLGKSVEQNGLTLELVRIGDPVISPTFWVYSGNIIFSSDKKNPPPELSPKEEGGEGGGILEPYPLGTNNKAKTEPRYPTEKVGVYFPTDKDILHNVYLGGLLLWNCPVDGNYKISLSGFYLKRSFNKKTPDRVPVTGLTGWGNNWDEKLFPKKNYSAIILTIDNRVVEPGKYSIKAGQKIFIRFNFAKDNPAEYFWNGQPVVLDYPENRLTLFVRPV